MALKSQEQINIDEHDTNLKARTVSLISGLIPASYDFVELLPPGEVNPTTINFKTGGSGGTTISTLTLTYVNDELNTVEKT